MSNDIQKALPLEEQIESKRRSWGAVGVIFHSTEVALQARAAELKQKLAAVPKEPKDLVAAEVTLKEAKQARKAIEEDRKKITERVMGAIKRIMQPEQQVDADIEIYQAAIIAVKKKKQEYDDKQKLKTKELAAVAEKVRLYIANTNAEYLRQQAQLISDSYTAALNGVAGKMPPVPPESIAPYIAKVKARINATNRTMVAPAIAAIANTQQDIDAEIVKHFKPLTAQQYIDGFAADIDLKYADYELAWKNKEQALKINEEEALENSIAIDRQQSADVATAAFQAMSVSVSETTTKPLKKSYAIDLPETLESAKVIITAYMSNTPKCDPELRITKWFSGFGVKQMIQALENLKNDDNNFTFTGLAWKTVDKL
jgi:hypothetical protein